MYRNLYVSRITLEQQAFYHIDYKYTNKASLNVFNSMLT